MKVIIKDSTNFYNGKVANVLEKRVIGDAHVYWVKVGNVEFAILDENIEPYVENVTLVRQEYYKSWIANYPGEYAKSVARFYADYGGDYEITYIENWMTENMCALNGELKK